MELKALEIASLRIKFQELLNLVDKSIEDNRPIQIRKAYLSQKNNNIKFLKWLQKHKIIKLQTLEKPSKKRHSIQSRARKIEISLQLKALGANITNIANKFKVKTQTVQGYFKNLGSYKKDYLTILNLILKLKGISPDINLTEFPSFPIRISMGEVRDNLTDSNIKAIEDILKNNQWITLVTGQSLGTSNISILLPEKK